MTTTEKLGRNVRTIARHQRITMKALSEAMGYKNVQVLYTRLSGESRTDIEEVERLAEILGTTVSVLLSDPSGLLIHQSTWDRELADQAA